MRPFNDLLSEQEESDIRIRRTILIGLFSFWELSLKYICAYYKLDVAGMKGIKLKKESQLKNDRILFSENDYLKAIFHSERPNIVDVISSKIKELRNYMTHGSADKNRQAVIDSIISEYPDFFVKKTHDGYYITSYDGYNRKNEMSIFQKRNEQIFSFFASFFLLLFRPLKHQLKADFKPLKQA